MEGDSKERHSFLDEMVRLPNGSKKPIGELTVPELKSLEKIERDTARTLRQAAVRFDERARFYKRAVELLEKHVKRRRAEDELIEKNRSALEKLDEERRDADDNRNH